MEILLLDWYPRKIMADLAYLQRMPEVLDGFVRFAHAEVGLDDAATLDALRALAAYEESYRDAVGPDDDGLVDIEDLEAFKRAMLAEMVGGEAALDALTTEPLRDEPFDPGGIPDAIRPRVAETLDLTDRCCDELLDVEHRTAVRRLLHDVAVAEPRGFDGRSKPAAAAAGLCWMVGRADETVGRSGLQSQELMAWFGRTALPTARAESIRRALGLDRLSWPASLGSARYLTGRCRSDLIKQRDAGV